MLSATRMLALLLTSLVFAPAARAQDITLPQDTSQYATSGLPGYELVKQNCLICHSAHYVLYQPSGSPRAYWDAVVHKMKQPFGAFFPDEDIPAMVDYLVKTYGAERLESDTATTPR